MSLMESFVTALKLNDENVDEEEYLDDEDYQEETARSNKQDSEPADKKPKFSQSVARKRTSNGTGMQVCSIKPTSIEDAREIIDTLLSNRPVVLNMESLDSDIAQRILDYSSGATYAIGGNLQKIAHYIFILTPASVEVSGDFQGVTGESMDSGY
ncbi:MAG: cell division protein SepF [Lachnospiraceae bacterium]|nr:cell division protein SepF [Lachnospiraceae bacterium]